MTTIVPRAWVAGVLVALAWGCGDDDGGGSETDAGGGTDAGMDAGASVLACEGSVDDVYVTPPDLPPLTESAHGEVVRCAMGDPLAADEIQSLLETHGGWDGPAIESGAQRYYLAFRTPRADGDGAISSAVLYLPTEVPEDPRPLVVVGHPTTGMADHCAPSRQDMSTYNQQDAVRSLLPLVGHGHPVVVPDYIGLGTEGTHGFLVVDEAAHTILDAMRAAMQVAPEGMLDGRAVLVGYSQGGHAVLAAQAAQAEYAPELEILGVSAASPPWVDLSGIGLLLSAPSEPVDGRANFAGMYAVAHQAVFVGEEDWLLPIHADIREEWGTLYTENCHAGQRDRLVMLASSIGELFSMSFRSAVSNCMNLGICDARGELWRDLLLGHRPPLDSAGPPVRVHLSTGDDTMDYRVVACDLEDEAAAGVDLAVCMYDGVLHTDMSIEPMPWILEWLDAVIAGTAEPTCEAPTFCEATADGGVTDGGVTDGGV